MANIDPNKQIQQGTDLANLDMLYRLQSIMSSYVIKNIMLTGKAEQADIVTFINPNLYRVAVQYYGDVNYWTVIANANNLTDPKVTGTVTLLIPPKPALNSGAILNPSMSAGATLS